jgi:hypothetical protein
MAITFKMVIVWAVLLLSLFVRAVLLPTYVSPASLDIILRIATSNVSPALLHAQFVQTTAPVFPVCLVSSSAMPLGRAIIVRKIVFYATTRKYAKPAIRLTSSTRKCSALRARWSILDALSAPTALSALSMLLNWQQRRA